MSIKFSIYETPKPNDRKGKTLKHARLQPNGTKRMDDICEHITQTCSLNSSDVKGSLEAFYKYVSFQLRYGYSVELEGLGHFSVGLRSIQGKKENGREVTLVKVDGVNFRCSPRLKKEIKKGRLEKVKKRVKPFPEIEERQKRMVNYLESYGTINQSQYARLNGCTRHCASADLKVFTEKGIIAASGGSTHKVYLLLS